MFQRWFERAIGAILLAVALAALGSMYLQLRDLQRDAQGVREEIDFAREAQGKAERGAQHCFQELAERRAQLELVDRWMKLAAGFRDAEVLADAEASGR